MRTVPGSGAQFTPIFNSDYGVESFTIGAGGTGYDSNDPPKIEVQDTNPPVTEGVFFPIIRSGEIVRIAVLESGFGYSPLMVNEGTKVGIATTSFVESSLLVRTGVGSEVSVSVAGTESHIIMDVQGSDGTSILENGYNKTITQTGYAGTSAPVVPDGSGNQNAFYGFTQPFEAYKTSGIGTGAKFNVFIVYASLGDGSAISTSIVLREGGRNYAVGDTVSIAGTYMGGQTPLNDLSFTVNTVANTRIPAEANAVYSNLEAITEVGSGTSARFEVARDGLGDISRIDVEYGGVGYALTSLLKIEGTQVGGLSPADDIFLSPRELGADTLPSKVYVQKLDDNNFTVSGLSTSARLDITSVGDGVHSFEYPDSDESTIISIDNIVQNSLYRRDLSVGLAQTVGFTDDKIYLTGVSSITVADTIQIGTEYFKINTMGIGATNEIGVTRGYLGTKTNYHPVGTAVTIHRGDYNIVKDQIHFTTAPYGPTGPEGLKINSSFSGRAFSRRFDPGTPNDKNVIFDDLSTQFVGSSSTEFFLRSNEQPVVGVYTNTNTVLASGVDVNNHPLIFINNIPQISGTDFTVDSASGENRLRFLTGSPSAGKIVRTGITSGIGYAPLIGAGAVVSITNGEVTGITLRGFGSGYRQPPLISLESSAGTGAAFTCTVGAGGTISSISVVSPGTGYTAGAEVNIGIPSNYFSVPLVYADGYTGNGEGAKADITVGNSGDIISFQMYDPGEFYAVGDILTPDTSSNGLVTSTSGTFTEFLVEVEEILTDKFSGFYPGQFIQFDDISRFFNGSKRKFTLTVTQAGETEILSLKIDPTSDLDLAQNMFVYINDILQAPNDAYDFDGSRIVFTEAPVPNSKCTILYYRGSDLDVEQVDPPRTIKEGDSVQIADNAFDVKDRPQFPRVVKRIVSANSLDTFTYDSIGINTDPDAERPVNWYKQTEDKIINGVLYSKARPDLKSRVEPTAKLIKPLTAGAQEIYVDNAYPLFVDVDQLSEDINNVKVVDTGDVRPAISSATVSAASTVSGVSIIDGGQGFYRTANPVVAISSAIISKKDPIYGWVGISTNSGISTTNTFNDIVIGEPIVAVGSSGVLGISTNGFEWAEEYIGYGNTINFNSVAVAATSTFFVAGNNKKLVVNTGVNTGFTGTWTELRLLKETAVIGLPDPVISFSTYDGNFSSVVHSEFHNSTVVVGDNNGIFNGVGIGTTSFFERTPPTFADYSAVATNGQTFVGVGNNATIIYSTDGGFIWAVIPPIPSTRDFNDVIWAEDKFIAVGDNGTIFTSTSGFTNWNRVIPNITDHLIKIKYEYGVYVVINQSGKILFSLDLEYWTIRETNQTETVSDVAFIPVPEPAYSRPASVQVVNEDGRFILVGAAGTIMYADPVYNRATAVATLTNDAITSVDIVNPGFGYLTPPPVMVESGSPLQEEIFSIKAEGDFGEIVHVGIGNTFIDFKLKSEQYDNATLGIGYSSLNTFGITNSQISEGDYFIITNSNSTIGSALTGITTSSGGLNNYAESVVGTAYTTLDGVYRAERVSAPHAGIVTVRCMFALQNGGAIQVNTNNNTDGIHGKYSWGKIFGYQNRAIFSPKHFNVNTMNGLTGISTSADVFRTRGLK